MTVRKPLIAGNWKMNGLLAETKSLISGIVESRSHEVDKTEVVICPPFTVLKTASDLLAHYPIGVGGQDCHAEKEGAHTGDISALMLKDLGCSHVILGHSERRLDHGESDAVVHAKVVQAHAAGLIAIICVGETCPEREQGQTFEVVGRQILGSVPISATAANTVIAYEPVWAIGTGKVATPEQAQEVHAHLRKTLGSHLGQATAEAMRILYGGSMKPANAKALLALPDVDGGLIGGAALKAEEFTAIIAAACA